MAADDEKYIAFRELKAKLDSTSNQIKHFESNRRQNEVNLRRAAFTAAHLSELPETVVTYRAVGKGYFLEPKTEVMDYLQGVVEGADRELKSAADKRGHLEETQRNLIKELNELTVSS